MAAMVVKKWGNSAAVRIPAALLAEAGLEIDQPVQLRSEKGRIIIEPVRKLRYDLDELVAGIRPDNVHEAVDTGPPVGREVW
jgi:antitoxin MazE